jgi:hypothetical protein
MIVRSYGKLAVAVRRRLGWKAGATVLAVAMAAAGAAIALPGTAGAATCTSGTPLASCTTTGSADMTSGSLTIVPPATLTWTAPITGKTQTIYDTTDADTTLDVSDLRGLASGATGSGWNITATATPFTGTTTAYVIPDTAGTVLAFGGGGTSGTATNVPSSVCATASTCTTPTNSETGYPLFVSTATGATATALYNAAAGTGTGLIQIGSDAALTEPNPAVWSVTMPGDVRADTYTSTITTTVAAGPT